MMRQFLLTTVKLALFAVLLAAPGLVSAQIFPIGTTTGTTSGVPRAYPNPFDQVLNVEVANPGTIGVRVQLVNAMGQVTLTQNMTWTPTLAVNTSSIADGTYTLNVYNDMLEPIWTKKVIRRSNSIRR